MRGKRSVIHYKSLEKGNSRFKYASKRSSVIPSMVSSTGSMWTRFPYLTSAQWCTETTSPTLTLRFDLTTSFIPIFGASHVSSASTMQTVFFLFFPVHKKIAFQDHHNASPPIWNLYCHATEKAVLYSKEMETTLSRMRVHTLWHPWIDSLRYCLLWSIPFWASQFCPLTILSIVVSSKGLSWVNFRFHIDI